MQEKDKRVVLPAVTPGGTAHRRASSQGEVALAVDGSVLCGAMFNRELNVH
jgi:hypothetical protein